MDFSFISEVPRPLGLEAETARVANEIRQKYPDFFAWVQAGENLTSLNATGEYLSATGEDGQIQKAQVPAEAQGPVGEPWLLGKADIEYFYHLARPADVGCACPYGWVEKVERVVDQQYPVFGVERFPDLWDKAAHVLWLIIKNEVFSEYNAGVGVLAALVLLERNGIAVHTHDAGLRALVLKARALIAHDKDDLGYDEDDAVRSLGSLLRAD